MTPTAGALLRQAAVRDGWPKPLRVLDGTSLPLFPVDALGDSLATIARALAVTYQVPEEYATGVVLASLSTATAGRLEVDVRGGQPMPAVLWILAVMPSAAGKSSALRPVLATVAKWEREVIDALVPELAAESAARLSLETRLKSGRHALEHQKNDEAREASANQVAALQQTLADLPRAEVPLIRAGDITPEALVANFLPVRGERAAILASEGTFLRVAAGRYARRDEGGTWEALVAAFDGDPVERDRVGNPRDPGSREPIRLRSPRVSILQAIQPNVFRQLLANTGFREQGALGRFLPLLPRDLRGLRDQAPPPLPAAVTGAIDLLLRRMLGDLWRRSLKDSAVLTVMPAAREIWLAFATEVEGKRGPGGVYRPFDPFAGRMAEIAARVAALLHAADQAFRQATICGEIDAETMTRAITLVRAVVPHAERLWAGDVGDATLDRVRAVQAWLVAQNRPIVTRREVHQALRPWFRHADDVDAVMDALEEVYVVRRVGSSQTRRPVPGRPSGPRWEVSPYLREPPLANLITSKPATSHPP